MGASPLNLSFVVLEVLCPHEFVLRFGGGFESFLLEAHPKFLEYQHCGHGQVLLSTAVAKEHQRVCMDEVQGVKRDQSIQQRNAQVG